MCSFSKVPSIICAPCAGRSLSSDCDWLRWLLWTNESPAPAPRAHGDTSQAAPETPGSCSLAATQSRREPRSLSR